MAEFRWSALLCAVLLSTAAGDGIGKIPPQPEMQKQPQLGVYRWANKSANVDAFAEWLDRPTVWAVDFIGGESWDNVEWPTWWLEGWSGPGCHGTGATRPKESEHVPDRIRQPRAVA